MKEHGAVVVRPATIEDVPAIQRIGLLTWPTTYLPIASPEFVIEGLATWWSAESVGRSIERSTTVVAVLRDEIVGTATVGDLEDAPVLWKLYVLPEAHGTGVADALLRRAIDAAGDRALSTEYVEGNERAARFYAGRGFVPVRTAPGDHGTTTVWCRRAPTRASPDEEAGGGAVALLRA